jgi:hypothetical protein
MKSPFLVLCTLLLIQFAFAEMPNWTLQKPQIKGAWVGVAAAPQDETKQCRNKARSLALQEIGGQIRIKINALSTMVTEESNDEFSQNIKNDIQAQVIQDLEGYQEIATYEDEDLCWIFLKLDHIKWEKIKQERLSKALKKYKTFEIGAVKAKVLSQSWTELRNRISAIQTVLPHLDEAIEIKGENPIESQRKAIEELFYNLKLTSVEAKKSWKLSLGDSIQHIAFLRLSYNSKSQSGWPVSWTGYSKQISDQKGIILGPITDYSTTKGQTLTASIKIEDALGTDSNWLKLTPILKGIKGPSTHLTLETEKKEIILKFSRLDEGNIKEMFSLRGNIKDQLGKLGFTFPKSPAGIKWLLEVQASTREYPIIYGLQPVEVDLIVTLINTETNTEVYSTHIPKSKGVGSNYATALSKAWKLAGKKLSKKLKKAFKSEIKL